MPDTAALAVAGALLLAGVPAAAAAALQVTVEGVRSGHGMVAVCVFAGPGGFPDCARGQRVAADARPARPGAMRFDFDVPPGILAVAVLHDENGNGAMDVGPFGIPREGGGVSNNPAPRRGKPLYREAAFRVAAPGGAVRIGMVYP